MLFVRRPHYTLHKILQSHLLARNSIRHWQSTPMFPPSVSDYRGPPLSQCPGDHLTIVTFSRMVGVALEAATELEGRGVSCEVINLRSLRPLDRHTILESVKKTHYVMSVEAGWPQCGVGSEVAACIMESKLPSFHSLATQFSSMITSF